VVIGAIGGHCRPSGGTGHADALPEILTLYGCTTSDVPMFPQLIRYITQSVFHPMIANTFTLAHIDKIVPTP